MSEVTNTNPPEETRWKPGQSGNPAGKPKGAIHLSTRIQNMLNDPDFKAELLGKDGKIHNFKGNPAEAIIRTAILKAMSGDKQWAMWLSQTGYGSKQIHEFEVNPIDKILEQYGLTNITEPDPPKEIPAEVEPSAIPDTADPALVSYAEGEKPKETKIESKENSEPEPKSDS